MSRLVMGKWVAEMHNKAELCNALANFNPISYKRLNFHCLVKYVDDVFTAADKIPRGCNANPEMGVLMWSKEQQEEDARDEDSRTMEEIARLAGSIFKCLNFTWDCPGKNENSKMPVLDTQLWMGVEAREKGVHREMDQSAPRLTKPGKLTLKNVRFSLWGSGGGG